MIGIYYASNQAKSANEAATTAKDQVDAAREQVRAADDQVAEMQRQTDATLASLEPQLEFVVVKTPRDVNESDPRLSAKKLHTWEWRVINHGGAPALDVKVVPNFDPDSTEHGEMHLGGIAAGESVRLWSRFQPRMPSYPEAFERLGGKRPMLAVTFDTIRGEHAVAALDVVERNEVDR
ncbi:hypothetical protein NS184_07865 [Curtobacterium luteum]|uniref:Uncharacterized protein n=1 Tax=Curtobacterium luteum TaxID=33881 RepID=A0A175RU01_9MICO|nr:hypothetical protein NS184_07865 [Curtobacterium luteum]